MNGHPLSSRNAGSSYTAPLYDTAAMTAALANPYAQHMSPHYYQAYLQASRPRTTTDGYTLSSTYVPGTANQTNRVASLPTPYPHDRPSVPVHSQSTARPIQNHLTFGSWFQPGNCRCTRQGCPFTGSRKSVEIHMMDRHFIFPPGWQKRKDDWDADPTLRGKPIAIQGTSVVLDTVEAVDAWIAERQRRFPTHERVQDKKRKLEEAVARGQLAPEDIGASARKKLKQNITSTESGSKRLHGKGHQRGRGRRREGMIPREELRSEHVDATTSLLADADAACEVSPGSASTGDDEAPEVASSRVPAPTPCVPPKADERDRKVQMSSQECPRRIVQPKKPLRNPFMSRPTLLRNLLFPEIRITVSNLSQAIRFLVENDFLRNVELRPGEAREQMIEVLGSDETLTPPPSEEPERRP